MMTTNIPSVHEMTRRELEQELIRLRHLCRPVNPAFLFADLTHEQIAQHITQILDLLKACQTSDTVGSLLVTIREDGIAQYGGTVNRSDVPAILRQLADHLEAGLLRAKELN